MHDESEALSPFERHLVDLVRTYSDHAIAPTDPFAITSWRPAVTSWRARWPAFPTASRGMIVLGLVLFALVVSLVVIAGSTIIRSRPMPILYTSGSQFQLHVLDPTTGADTVLPEVVQSPSWPTWSPDRKHLAFVASGSGSSTTLWVANADGQHARSLGDVWVDSTARYAWSPTSDRLAIQRTGCCLDIVDTGGTVSRRLFISGFKDSGPPSWSPDGGSIAVTGSDLQIVVAELATGQIRQLSSGSTYEYGPQWSPDGSTIAFSADTGGENDFGQPPPGTSGLDTIKADGSGRRVVVPLVVYGEAWAPDEHALAAVAWQTAKPEGGPDPPVVLLIGDPIAGSMKASLAVPTLIELGWSPDSSHLAYLTTTGELWTVRTDGTDPRRIAVGVTGFDW